MIITTSSAATFEKCEFRYYLRYRRGLVARKTVAVMEIGSFFHDGVAELLKGSSLRTAIAALPKAGELEDWQMEPWFIAKFLLEQYHDYWIEQPTRCDSVVDVERTIRIKIARGIWLAGKLDAICMKDDDLWVWEHKTTSSLSCGYLDKVVLDGQITTYLYLLWKETGTLPKGCVYNVVCRPAIHRRQNETIKTYLARAVEGYVSNPRKFFGSQLAFRSVDLITDYEREMKRLGRQIQGCARAGIWRKAVCNSSMACFARGMPCPYIPICEAGEDSAVLRNYEVKPPHSELDD